MGHYFILRLVRLSDGTHSIALGLAYGAAVSFVPLPGSHIFSAAVLSMATRVNILASLLGTLVGNPWTFPLMWWMSYETGRITFETLGLPVEQMPDHFGWRDLLHAVEAHPADLLLPWVVGGYIMAIISCPIFYLIFYKIVAKARLKHQRRREVL